MEVIEGAESTGGGTDSHLKKRTSSSPQRDADVSIGANKMSESAGHPCETDGMNDVAKNNSKRMRTAQTSPNVADEAGSESPAVPEKLEVPSKELQCIQKQVLIEKLMATSATAPSTEEPMDVQSVTTNDSTIGSKNRSKKQFRVPQPPSSKSQEFRKTFKLRSSLLDRVKVFLPEMKNANEELLRLPDPSKLSLESDSDRDEMDGAVAGPSGLSGKEKTTSEDMKGKTYVEMNLALVEQSDSDTSSDDDGDGSHPILNGHVKGLPTLNKTDNNSSSSNPTSSVSAIIQESPLPLDDKAEGSKESTGERNSLITELN